MEKINSVEWWNDYFQNKWEENYGKEQTAFFMQLIINELPEKIKDLINRPGTTIFDWGCALGQGVDLLAKEFPYAKVMGLDISDIAITKAKASFPNRIFTTKSLENINEVFTVIVCSNTLEHFENPEKLINEHLKFTRCLYIILVPYKEEKRAESHFVSFDNDSFPANIGDFCKIDSKIIDTSESTFWQGAQLLVVYAHRTLLNDTEFLESRIGKVSNLKINQIIDSQNPLLWDKVADTYAEEADSSEIELGHEIESLLAEVGINHGASLLEVGCGSGHLSGYLASKGFKTTLLDFSKGALEKAKAYYKRHNLTGNFILYDMMELSTEKIDPHDVVWNSGVLEHFDSWQVIEVLKRMGEIAQKFVIVIVPNARSIPYLLFRRHAMENNEWLWGRELLRETMQHLAEAAGLEVIEERYLGHHYSQGHLDYVKSELGQEYNEMYQQNLIPDEQAYLIAFIARLRSDKKIVGYEKLIEKILKEEAIVAQKTYVFDFFAISSHLQKVKEMWQGQINSLNQAVADRDAQVASLETQIQDVWASTSWRITSPLRFFKNMIRDPGRATYSLLKQIYWMFPVSLQKHLSGLRHIFIRFYLSRRKNSSRVRTNSKGTGDLSWTEFQSKVLTAQEQYKGIFIAEATIDWDFSLFQRPQHIVNAFVKLGYLAIYKTPNFYDNVSGFREISKNLWITDNNRVDTIRGAVRSFYSTGYVYTKKDYAARRAQDIVVYEYIDHIDPAISGDKENIRHLNNLKNYAFNGGVDFIVASAKALYEEAAQAVGEDKVILVPNGVDVDHYRDPRHNYYAIPESLSKFKNTHRAIVGYFGALAPWLWFEEIEKLVALRPDIGFVFIGPDYYGGSALLPKSKNTLRLEPVHYKILPGYALHFDVCFIPFRLGEIARTTSPLKLFEYFALEKPVVVTSDMLECVQFPEVLHGSSAEELSKCIDKALELARDEHFKKRLAKLAEQNSWVERAKKYEVVFKKRHSLGERVPLNQVQHLIANAYRQDDDGKTYYEQAYMAQEELYWRPVLQWITQLIGPVNSVIDIGAAYGTLLIYTALNKGTRKLHAVDPVGYLSSSLGDKFNIVFHPIDFEREDFEAKSKFDLVIFTEVIEHLNFHPLQTLLKIKRLISDDGWLIITTPDADQWGRVTQYYRSLDEIPPYQGQNDPRIDNHIWHYTKGEIETLFEKAGLRVDKFEYAPGVTARHLCYLLRAV